MMYSDQYLFTLNVLWGKGFSALRSIGHYSDSGILEAMIPSPEDSENRE